MIIEMFAIRHKPTGNYLPATDGFRLRGGTWAEPVPATGKRMPRLHATHKTARIVLTYWMKGKFSCYRDEDGGEDITIIPQANRVFEDMEIVAISLEIP